MSGDTATPRDIPEEIPGEITEDGLLGGRVRLRQPRRGFRAAIDPVLLAAGIPARPGERVLEAGCGTGAAFLCLAARVPGLSVVAIERAPAMAVLAAENAALNGIGARCSVLAADLFSPTLDPVLHGFHHAFANPPWWERGTQSPDAGRRRATHATTAALDGWAVRLGTALLRGGTLSLLLPAERLDAGLAALARARCGGTILWPFWPRAGVAARRVLLQGRKDHRGPTTLAVGTTLHASDGYGAAAEAVLRDAAPLPLSARSLPGAAGATAARARRPGSPCSDAGSGPGPTGDA